LSGLDCPAINTGSADFRGCDCRFDPVELRASSSLKSSVSFFVFEQQQSLDDWQPVYKSWVWSRFLHRLYRFRSVTGQNLLLLPTSIGRCNDSKADRKGKIIRPLNTKNSSPLQMLVECRPQKYDHKKCTSTWQGQCAKTNWLLLQIT
jgi:hypothetical protein